MLLYNVIIVYNSTGTSLLMCYREKEPYQHKYNFVGGKAEDHEDKYQGAYRELKEETGITNKDIKLKHFIDIDYYFDDMKLMVFVGQLNHEVKLVEEMNKLYWMDVNENYFDYEKFAGEGNIGFILREIAKHRRELFK